VAACLRVPTRAHLALLIRPLPRSAPAVALLLAAPAATVAAGSAALWRRRQRGGRRAEPHGQGRQLGARGAESTGRASWLHGRGCREALGMLRVAVDPGPAPRPCCSARAFASVGTSLLHTALAGSSAPWSPHPLATPPLSPPSCLVRWPRATTPCQRIAACSTTRPRTHRPERARRTSATSPWAMCRAATPSRDKSGRIGRGAGLGLALTGVRALVYARVPARHACGVSCGANTCMWRVCQVGLGLHRLPLGRRQPLQERLLWHVLRCALTTAQPLPLASARHARCPSHHAAHQHSPPPLRHAAGSVYKPGDVVGACIDLEHKRVFFT
jgi:hypothetical protein